MKYTLETTNCTGSLAFLDLNLINDERKNSGHWYQKAIDTGVILKFRSYAQLHRKKTEFKGLYVRF